jgi:hypothetical protein
MDAGSLALWTEIHADVIRFVFTFNKLICRSHLGDATKTVKIYGRNCEMASFQMWFQMPLWQLTADN